MSRRQIAVIVETMNAYGQGIVHGICRFLREREPHTIFYEERTLDSPPPRWLRAWRGDGIIVRDRSGKSCDIARKTGAKVVDMSERRAAGVPTVISDHAACSRLAATHLKQCGFEHFAFVGIAERPFSEVRQKAFVESVGDCFVHEIRDQQRATTSWDADNTKLAEWLRTLPKPVGVMACYDLAGVRVLQTCNQHAIDVPGEVAVIGVNNDPIQCAMTNPPMSSVVQNQERIGYEACSLLYHLMDGHTVSGDDIWKKIPPLGIAARHSTDIIVVPDQLVVRAIRLIREQACSGFSVADLASRLHVDRKTLERRFQKHLGRSPHSEIVETQMREAKELLSFTRLTISDVARRVGFGSVPHFNSQFTAIVGERPSQYRKEHE